MNIVRSRLVALVLLVSVGALCGCSAGNAQEVPEDLPSVISIPAGEVNNQVFDPGQQVWSFTVTVSDEDQQLQVISDLVQDGWDLIEGSTHERESRYVLQHEGVTATIVLTQVHDRPALEYVVSVPVSDVE